MLGWASRTGATGVRFTILTAGRAGETTGATWEGIGLDQGIWTIPATRMKMDREHKVPLSQEALAILREMAELKTDELVFPGYRARRPLSNNYLAKAIKAAGGRTMTTHGCRSTFKDWASERTSFPSEVSEMALAHGISDKTEAAYRRGDLMKKRAALMEQWARFLLTPPDANVVPIGRRRASVSPGR